MENENYSWGLTMDLCGVSAKEIAENSMKNAQKIDNIAIDLEKIMNS